MWSLSLRSNLRDFLFRGFLGTPVTSFDTVTVLRPPGRRLSHKELGLDPSRLRFESQEDWVYTSRCTVAVEHLSNDYVLTALLCV